MGLSHHHFAFLFAGILCLGAFSPAQTILKQQALTASEQARGTASSAGPAPRTAEIPGPLRSFLRMAGISQQVSPDGVLPMLARNVSVMGYEDKQETVYLKLIVRYVRMARELRLMTDRDGNIHVADCAGALPLLHVLGYKFHGICGQKDAFLITADAGRAFLTADSGFPLTRLEQDLQNHVPFRYSFPATQVPVLATAGQWAEISPSGKELGGTMLDILLVDPHVDRLYSALARIDPQTRNALIQSPGLKRLLPVAEVLDFYGSQLCIRSGAVAVPGGPAAAQAWRALAGADPRSPSQFVRHLLERDHGWLAAYFDALARVDPLQQAHLTQEPRLRQLYHAWRSTGLKYGAAYGVFPRNANLVLLFTRMQWGSNGEPLIPGNAGDWKGIFYRQDESPELRHWTKHAHHWASPAQVLEGLVAASNVETHRGPLQIYLLLSAIDRQRLPRGQMSAATVGLIAARFAQYHAWFQIFAEFPALHDASIGRFVVAADHVNAISNPALRANALGAFQADVGIWEILARQRQIAPGRLNASWQKAVDPFSKVSSSISLFEAARSSLRVTMVAAGGRADLTENEVVNLLAGPAQRGNTGMRVHDELAARMMAVLNDQRLVSLDTLFGLFDGLPDLTRSHAGRAPLLQMAAELHDFELPHPIFTESERVAWSPIVYSDRHVELQVKTDLAKAIAGRASKARLEAARGRLTPFLRDTLVGLNYAYYEPPGAQILRNDPLFVRAHDFTASSVEGIQDIWDVPQPTGVGVTAGGGSFLMGSLADLPLALACLEEDFIAPSHVQALIWEETVPVLLTDAVVPRWWNVSRDELHAVNLYQRSGEELLTASANNAQLRGKVIAILADCTTSGRLVQIESALETPRSIAAFLPRMLPAETFYLAAEFRSAFPRQAGLYGEAGRKLDDLARRDASAVSITRLRRDFGVPHLVMAGSEMPTLLFTGIFPTSGGYANRLFGESWESTNLYWARVADEKGYSPAMLNLLVPELTRRMAANIFGSGVGDWPALLRAMRQTGRQFQEGRIGIGDKRLIAARQDARPVATKAAGAQSTLLDGVPATASAAAHEADRTRQSRYAATF